MGHGYSFVRFGVCRASEVKLGSKDGLPSCLFSIESESEAAYWDFAVSQESLKRRKEERPVAAAICAEIFERGFSLCLRRERSNPEKILPGRLRKERSTQPRGTTGIRNRARPGFRPCCVL